MRAEQTSPSATDRPVAGAPDTAAPLPRLHPATEKDQRLGRLRGGPVITRSLAALASIGFCLIWLALIAGCSSLRIAPSPAQVQAAAPAIVDPQLVQATTMSFAARYMVAMADVYDRVLTNSTSSQAQELALQSKLTAGQGALSNAVNPNPIVGLMDMALMTTLTRQTMQDPWATEVLGPENATMIVQALKVQEADIWSLAANYLNPAQITELHALAQQWRKDHPNQRYVGGARLSDFLGARKANAPDFQLAPNILRLVRLDPFTGLDPAVRQVEESRVLAERMFFYLQDMPTLISWQADLLYVRMISRPQVAQLFKDTATVAGNSTDFTHATTQFADATSHFAHSIETFRTDLPDQQLTLVKQVNDMVSTQREIILKQTNNDIISLRDSTIKQLNETVAAQRDAALKQAGTEIATLRDASLLQISATMNAQRDLLATDLQAVAGSSIDRLYERMRSLILLASGALLAVLLIHTLTRRIGHMNRNKGNAGERHG